MQTITLITVGKQSDTHYNAAADEFIKRLGAFCKVNIVELAQVNLSEKNLTESAINKALKKEALAIENAIPKGSAVVAMCVEGKQLTSEEFAGYFASSAQTGTSQICFIIGSSHGLCANIKKRANLKLSLSKMTFPHKLFKVMLLEQIYRAFSITAGSKYHK